MSQYYFVVSAFPPLQLSDRPGLSFQGVMEMLRLNLSGKDQRKVESFLREIDLENLRAFLRELPLDERGNLDRQELQEAVLTQSFFSEYIAEFLQRYESTSERLRFFSKLYAEFYREEGEKSEGFLKEYLLFRRQMRLTLAALRAKKLGRDFLEEFQFEDPTDPFVAEILAQKEGTQFLPPQEFRELLTIFEEHQKNPLQLEKALLEFQLDRIEQMEGVYDFSIDRVLAYLARLLQVESWHLLDRKKGILTLEKLSQHG